MKIATTQELDIDKTFDCGQCFRWSRSEKGIWYGIAQGNPAEVYTENCNVYIRSNAEREFWRDYFDLNRDYSKISFPFGMEYLERCIEAGQGIRILHQEPWETFCSFIISQCNNIPRIKGIIERLCALFGDAVCFHGREYRCFPPPDRLSGLKEKDLEPIHSGYRAEYILNAATAICKGDLDLYDLKDQDWRLARDALMSVRGVGEKVANCTVLFGLQHLEAFPVDTWIKRTLKDHFPPDFKPESLGEYAGIAQQYIFYYSRLKKH